jgi:hypothetical protein
MSSQASHDNFLVEDVLLPPVFAEVSNESFENLIRARRLVINR